MKQTEPSFSGKDVQTEPPFSNKARLNTVGFSQNITGFPVSFYFNKIYSEAAKIAESNKSDVCLDFGCGSQRLKPFIKKGKYVGYDVIEEFSDVKSYRDAKPSIFLALNVLEHLEKQELEEVCSWLCEVKPQKIVVSLPADSSLSRFSIWFLGRGFKHEVDHVLSWQQVVKVLREHFDLVGYKRVFFMQWVSLWKLKGNEK